MRRRKRFNWTNPVLIFGSFVIMAPLFAQTIKSEVRQIIQSTKIETKQNQTESKPEQVPIKVEQKKINPQITPKPVQTPKVTPITIKKDIPPSVIDAAITCSITDSRPPNSKWIVKDRQVGLSIRYTTDIYEINESKDNSSKTYYYILRDKIDVNAKNKTVGNFAIAYQKQQIVNKTIDVSDKLWEIEYKGCGLEVGEDKSVPLVSIFDNEEMIKSMRLDGIQKIEKIGRVQKPSTYIRVLNELDLTETK